MLPGPGAASLPCGRSDGLFPAFWFGRAFRHLKPGPIPGSREHHFKTKRGDVMNWFNLVLWGAVILSFAIIRVE